MPGDADLIDFDEALKLLSVSPERLENLVMAGELTAFRRGRAISFRRQDVADYLVRHGDPAGPGGARLESDDRRAKAVAAKIASLRRSHADDASALLERLGAGGEEPEELVSLKEKMGGRGAEAASPQGILVELRKELSLVRRRADEAETKAGEIEDERQKLLGQLQLLDSLREEVKQVTVLARENDELRKRLSGREADVEAAERTAHLEREGDRLKEQLKGAEDALAALQERASEVSSLRAEKRELEQKLEQAREEARASLFVPPDEHVQRAVAYADELASERKRLADEIKELRKQAGRLEARLSAVEAERDGAVRKLKETETSLEAVPMKDEELERLQKELEDVRKELESAKEDAASGLKNENESLKSELAELREKIEDSAKAEGQLEEMRSEVERLRSEREELREELRGAQVTLGHMRADAGQSKRRAKELEETRNEAKELRKEYDQISARMLAAESARDEAKSRANELQSEASAASAAREEANSLRAELDSVTAALGEEKERARGLEGEREAETGALKEEMESLRASLAEAEAAAASAEEMSSLRAELEGARARSSELEGRLEEAKEQLQAAIKPEELDSLNAELEEARRELEAAVSPVELDSVKAKLEEAGRELEAAVSPEELDSLKAELEEARSRSSELELDLQEARAQIEAATGPEVLESARTELKDARSRSSQLEDKLEEAKRRLQGAARAKRVKKLESELEIVRSRARELEGKLAEAETSSEEIEQLREQLEGVSAELESTRAEKEEALSQLAALETSAGETDEFRAQLAEARKGSETYRLELSRREGALAALQAQLEKARNAEEEAKGLMGQLAELREKLARIEGEVEPLRKERDDLATKLQVKAPTPVTKRPTVIMVGVGSLPPDAPKKVGRFTLVGLIGMGRKGAVFTASSPYAAGAAAVRILSEELRDDPRFMEQFLPRIRRVAELENKSIVDVLDTGEFPRGYFVATELIDGGSLRQRLEASGRINPDETLAIIMQLTKALEVARRARLVHRDIRPENILFTHEGTPKLSDLGLSLGTSEDGCSVGKGRARHYAAPEQVRGKEVDCKADVFSLGAVTYEMLTGTPIFQAATRDGTAGLYDSVVLDPPDCPPGLALVVARMLCKSPENRYAAPKDLATDFILLSEGAEPKAPAPGEGESFIRGSG